MINALKNYFDSLINRLSSLEDVSAIGKTGGADLPDNSDSDVDLFIFCARIPELPIRRSVINASGGGVKIVMFSERGGRWGTMDIISVENTEICLMYFTETEMSGEIDEVLQGRRLDKGADGFYPIGRCATLLSLHVLYDKNGYIAAMKERLSVYPQDLQIKMLERHLRKAHDAESFSRAVSRKDTLFYHEVAENAIDRFLQALFALNKCYFPSRKRNISFIDGFTLKPVNCADRLLQMIKYGAAPETLAKSYKIWTTLYNDLKILTDDFYAH